MLCDILEAGWEGIAGIALPHRSVCRLTFMSLCGSSQLGLDPVSLMQSCTIGSHQNKSFFFLNHDLIVILPLNNNKVYRYVKQVSLLIGSNLKCIQPYPQNTSIE